MNVVAVLLGMFLGGVVGQSVFGVVAGGVIGALAWRSREQGALVRRLAQAVDLLQRRAADEDARARAEGREVSAAVPDAARAPAVMPAEAARPPAAIRPAGPAPARPLEPMAPPEPPARPRPEAIHAPEPAAAVPAPAPAPEPEPEPAMARAPARAPTFQRAPQPDAFDRLRAWLFGGNTVAKVGIAILFVGLAFLAKYATEHVVVPIEWRLAGIGAAAAVLLVLGWRWRESRPGYAHVLQGGAIAVWYLTLFAAFRFHGVLAAGPAFVLMLVVAALAAALAVLQDAPALALIGALGGFATPLLTATGGGDPRVLFGYYLLLDAGIAAVAWSRSWRALNVVGFLFTYGVGTAWGLFSYTEDRLAMSEFFLVAFFLLFNLILLLPARRADADDRAGRWVHGLLLFGVPTVTFALQHGLVHDTRFGTALSALAMAGFYAFLASALRRRASFALAFDGAIGVSLVLLSLVIPFALDARDTVGAWAMEGAGLVWIGARQGRRLPRVFGYALLLLPTGSMAWSLAWRPGVDHWMNGVLVNALLASAAMAIAARAVRRGVDAGRLARAESPAEPLAVAGAVLWSLFAADFEISRFVPAPLDAAAWAGALSALAAVGVALRARLGWTAIAAPTLGHAPLVLLLLLGLPAGHAPLASWGALLWPLAVLVHLAVLRVAADDWPAPLGALPHACGVLLLAALLGREGWALTEGWGEPGSAWPWIGGFVGPALVLLALLQPRVQARWPVSRALDAYLRAGAGLLVAFLLLASLPADLFCDGSAAPLPWVPLLNPLDVGQGLMLAMAWRWADELEALSLMPVARGRALVRGAIGLAGFSWLNAMLVRGFHHYDGVPFHVDAWFSSPSVQAGLAVLWTATALGLMWGASRRGARTPWLAGAGLLGAVVLKLLMVDLAASGTVTRIVSFISVGVGMLVIGYVAPMPGREGAMPGRGAPSTKEG